MSIHFKNDFFENNTFSSLFAWIGEELGFDKKLYLLPRTVSESEAHYFLWDHSKFYDDNGDQIYGNGLKQAVPTSFLIIYWMGRAFNIF